MKIAIEGCAHGNLDKIYSTIEYIEKENNINIDLLLCCGDFQAVRNLSDMKCMAVLEKYQLLCSFYKYYSGEKVAPKLTIVIGGNHEASNYFQELPYGGWLAPNIYYMGYAGVVNIAGIRIAGLSGIFKIHDYLKGRYERPPYNAETLRSCYHVRNLEIFRLKQLTSPLHIIMTHDWPNGIANYGNKEQLLRFKPFLKEDIKKDQLGNPMAAELLNDLKPDYWFAAHLHAKYAALVKHEDAGENKVTKFLALDKCLPGRRFLQVVDIPHKAENPLQLEYDLEWLTILHLTNHLTSIKKLNNYMPGPGSGERWKFVPTKDEMDLVLNKFNNDLVIPKNFVVTAPPHSPDLQVEFPTKAEVNPQTVEFCSKLGIDDPMELLQKEGGFSRSSFSQNVSRFESSSFVGSSDSEMDVSTTLNNSQSLSMNKSLGRSPLKLPTPKVSLDKSINDDFLTSTPVVKLKEKKDIVPDDTQDLECEINKDENTTETPKIFKRRNMAMYSNDADDD